MKTVNEVSKLTGVSIRTLQYYDKIGLLRPTEYTESGYRLYDDTALERLQQILLFRELEFSLSDIESIIDRIEKATGNTGDRFTFMYSLQLVEERNPPVVAFWLPSPEEKNSLKK